MKNRYEIRGDATAIFLVRQGVEVETLIDTEDFDKVSSFPNTFKPQYDSHSDGFYAVGSVSERKNGKRQYHSILLHRLITDAPKGMVVDHLNHNTLDNRKCNLVVTDYTCNMQNRIRANKNNMSSGILGVTWYKRRQMWRVKMKVNGRERCFGYFTDLSEAAKVASEKRALLLPHSQEALAKSAVK